MDASPQAHAQVRATQDGLWDKAPAWRNLTMAASLLTLAAVAIPVLLPEQPAPAPKLAVTKSAATTPAVTPSPQLLPAHRARVALSKPQTLPPAYANSVSPPPAALPQTSAPAQTVCNLRQQATAPVLVGIGTVTGFEDHAEALARIQVSEAQSGGKIDPDYVENTRAFVQRLNGTTAVVIVPKGMNVAVGDRVTVTNGYRNMALPCNYVPVLVASDIGPAPAAGGTR